MVKSLIILKNLKKKKKSNSVFFITTSFHNLVFSYKNFICRDLNFLYAKVYFFSKIYYFYKDFFINVGLLNVYKKSIFFLSSESVNNCFLNMQKIYSRFFVNNYMIFNFNFRNFFISFRNYSKQTYISGGCGKNYRTGRVYRSKKFKNNNFIRCARKHYQKVFANIFRYLTFIFKKLTSRISFIVRVYFIIFKVFNKFFKLNRLRLSKVLLNRCKIFGYMRGERKPRRKKVLVKRAKKFYN